MLSRILDNTILYYIFMLYNIIAVCVPHCHFGTRQRCTEYAAVSRFEPIFAYFSLRCMLAGCGFEWMDARSSSALKGPQSPTDYMFVRALSRG